MKAKKLVIMIGIIIIELTTMIVATDSGGGEPIDMRITSPAFAEREAIPEKYTCEGRDISPPLIFTGIPEANKSLVLIVDDPDAPDPNAPKMTWVHWLLFNLPPQLKGLDENIRKLPEDTEAGRNDWKRRDYGGPCPPIGRHRYFFKLYALDIRLNGLIAPDKTALLQAIQGHVLEQAELIGTYLKQR
ncbi:MAG: YbhB/YbcL family Raf kinase inhibitor-like protein [Mariprofundus sp.]|nr:YbhB/YbcL family Raf kinase inhibitor-like protein [Mariprofundus sp.]